MIAQLKNINFYFVLLGDIIVFSLANIAAYLIRFEFQIPEIYRYQMAAVLPLIVGFKILTFYFFGLYKGMYRYSSLPDVWRLGKATLFSSLVIITIMLIVFRFQGFSRAVFIMDAAFTFLFAGGLRLGIRMAYQEGLVGKDERPKFVSWRKRTGKPVIIVGAGDAGEKTLREIVENPRLPYRVIGFIDDDRGKSGRSIHDVPILGGIESLKRYVELSKVEEVFITVPSATGSQMRKIVDTCEEAGVRFRTLPGMGELINGKVSVKALRDVNFQDLLGRPSVELDEEGIEAYLKGKSVLVTGGGGSIGSELCRQIMRFNPEQLILLDADEEALYGIQVELTQRISYGRYIPVLGGVQNKLLLNRVFQKYKPDVVFHAAAYKHVPLIEENPWQGVFNNILGAQRITEACIAHGAERFVLVSTDKAVRPTNVMGASKRVCELIMQANAFNGCKMMAVRFGNVVGSSGSVIPLFREQIARGGPVTVTHPEITRYFMTIPESCQLILQAGALGEGGELFLLEMGTPVKIVDMARDLIRLSGKEPDRDIEITYTGLRPGEKLYEELITEGEGIVETDHEKILVIKPDGLFDGHGSRENFMGHLMIGLKDLYRLAALHDGHAIRTRLKQIVPEYTPQDSESIL